MSTGDLKTPTLLIAMPQVLDPFFHHSVVLLVHHDEEGSFGFIVNRPTGIRVAEILAGMDISWGGEPSALAHFGGPVQPQLGSVLFVSADHTSSLEAINPVLEGVAVTQHVGDLQRLAVEPPEGMRLFLGYAGWGAGQLIDEIQRDDWLLAPVQHQLLFHPDPEKIWEEALGSVGVDSGSLPSWSMGGGGHDTN